MDEDHIHLTGYTAEDVTPGIDLNVADNICGADAVSQLNSLKSQFFEQIVPEAKENLEVDEDVPIWLALAAFHHAEVWVEGRKQPSTIKEAMRLPEWNEWREAIRKEILGLIEIGVWAEIPREAVPKGVKVLPGKMILEIKTEDGKFKKCKARYVSRGDLSSRGEHYWETSSHQVRSKSLRIYFATSAVDYARTKRKSFIPRNLDIRQAYINESAKLENLKFIWNCQNGQMILAITNPRDLLLRCCGIYTVNQMVAEPLKENCLNLWTKLVRLQRSAIEWSSNGVGKKKTSKFWHMSMTSSIVGQQMPFVMNSTVL